MRGGRSEELFNIFSGIYAHANRGGGGVAQVKGKPEGKGKPGVTYVFKGKVSSVGEDYVTLSVEKGNSFAKSYAGKDVDFSVDEQSTKVVEDDEEATLSDLDADDRALVQVKAPKGSTSDFSTRMVVAESPVAYYLDGDSIGAAEPTYFFAGEEPEDYVGTGGDNCLDVSNAERADADGAGIGDACDDDAGDGAVDGTV